jgi:hypothetical protein
MDKKQPSSDDLEFALSKIASFVPELISPEKLKDIIVDKIPKAFYYQLLLDLLSSNDNRPAELVLTEARFLVKLLLFKVDRKNLITTPQTKI